VRLFVEVAFNDKRSATKEIYPSDLVRLFVLNNLILEQERLALFYGRIIKNKQFDLKTFAKLITSCTRESIIDSTTVKVQGHSQDHRRTMPLLEQNINLAYSMTP